jgi:GGDEF domain-containing protein
VADALRDEDTGLLNEAYLRAALPNRVATARRVLRPISIAVVALEDEALATSLSYALQDSLRESDTACRLDDGRFVLLLEDTPEDGAVWTIERTRRLLAAQGGGTTLWGGVASYPAHALEADALLAGAEAALDAAKQWPGSRIEVAVPTGP